MASSETESREFNEDDDLVNEAVGGLRQKRAFSDTSDQPQKRHKTRASDVEQMTSGKERDAVGGRVDQGSNMGNQFPIRSEHGAGHVPVVKVKENGLKRKMTFASAGGHDPLSDPSLIGEDYGTEDDNTKLLARKVAEHYSARTNQTLEEREASPIIHMKKLNNWIKSVLIQLYARRGDIVLDLACGKGGDLIKWDKAKVGYYVGVDIAEGSIEDCRTRYNGETDQMRRRKTFSFPARLLCADCFEVRLDEALQDDAPFDICSCQFALHYSWSTEERARRTLANVSALLRPGGIFIGTMPDANVIVKKLREAEGLSFGNSVYWICFDESYAKKKFNSSHPFGIQYKFHLEDAVDCPEWLVPFHKFQSLAEEYGLELVFKKNSHAFVHEYIKKGEFSELMRRLGALGDGTANGGTLSGDEWEAAYLYLVFVLRKRGQGEAHRKSTQRRSPSQIMQKDILYLHS